MGPFSEPREHSDEVDQQQVSCRPLNDPALCERTDSIGCRSQARRLYRLVGIVSGALAMTVLLTGCQTDAQRIRTTNEALATLGVEGTALSAQIQSIDLKEGDCIDSTLPEGVSIETVEIVVCAGEWQYRVLNSFEVAGADHYPGERYFSRRAEESCDRRFTYFLYPLSDSWNLGERTVDCLQHSFGLAVDDPDKLDRLVNSTLLAVGECFNEAPETGGQSVELVECSGEWDFKVLASFEVPDYDAYPGDDYFSEQANERCDSRHSSILYPLAETWDLEDRTVSCLQDSFGLSFSDPDKLDRLVNVGSLNPGQCFNEPPETDHVLVEVVHCDRDWELQVTERFQVSVDGAFPGAGYIERQATQHCGSAWDFYYGPSAETWTWGNRTIVCAKASEPLSQP